MRLFEVFQFQLDAAAGALDGFSVRRGKDFIFLNDSAADMKKMPACVLFIQGIRNECQYHWYPPTKRGVELIRHQ